jgi:hypothetical protein
MGGAKREWERQQDLEAQATEPLLKAGAIRACCIHSDILINLEDPDAERRAYAIGTNMVKAGEVDGTRADFMDAIKSALENAADECPICAKYRDED